MFILLVLTLCLITGRMRSNRVKQEYRKVRWNQTVLKMDSGGENTDKKLWEVMRIQEVITDARVLIAEQGNMLRERVMIQELSLQPTRVNIIIICS